MCVQTPSEQVLTRQVWICTRCQDSWLGLVSVLPVTCCVILNKSLCPPELIYFICEMKVLPALQKVLDKYF